MAFAIAAAGAMTPALGDELGTLFHTPKERADLDRLRRGESLPGQASQGQQGTYARPDPVVTGYVKRSDGKSTVFIDEQPYPIHGGKLQEKLEPRIVQRYFEPAPRPVPAPPAQDPKVRAPGTSRPAPTTE
jgi:hypothetical protein